MARPPRFQYPLYKLFLVAAVYAVAFKANMRFETEGIVVAAVTGTAGSLLVLAIRSGDDIGLVIHTSAGCLLGIVFGLFFVPAVDHGMESECSSKVIMPSIGAAVGGIAFSLMRKR